MATSGSLLLALEKVLPGPFNTVLAGSSAKTFVDALWNPQTFRNITLQERDSEGFTRLPGFVVTSAV